MDPKQAREIAEEQGGPLKLRAAFKHPEASGFLLTRAVRTANPDEQKGIDVAAFTSSV